MEQEDIQLIKGGVFSDNRGMLFYNNEVDLTKIKRVYIINNTNIEIKREWQGHQIESRWFSVIQGRFLIKLVKPNNWIEPSKDLEVLSFELSSETLDYLVIPPGYVSSIQSLEKDSKLMVMSDYSLGEINGDEYKFEKNYWL